MRVNLRLFTDARTRARLRTATVGTAMLAAWAMLAPLAQADVGGYHYGGKLWPLDPLQQQPVVQGHEVAGAAAAKTASQAGVPYGARALTTHRAQAPSWPTASTSEVSLANPSPAAAGVRAGTSPVSLLPVPAAKSAKALASSPRSVQVKVAGHAQAKTAGVDGVLVGLSRTDGQRAAGRITVKINYSSIAQAYGGGWASRLHLVAMPGCALTTPRVVACLTRTPLATKNDAVGRTLSAAVSLPVRTSGTTAPNTKAGTTATAQTAAAPMDIAVAAVSGTQGSQGNYTATSLSASGSWSQSATGAFTYSYPIAMPASLGGSAPPVVLSYNSQSIDGETSARNSQSSWIGDGWTYSPGFIERSYKSCDKDGIKDSGDNCWAGYNATLSLGSHNGELVRDSDGLFHLQADDGTRIERLTGASNGLWQGEYYKVTTTDGTAYYFGIDHTPGTTADDSTDSAWGIPVYHPKSSDPCYDSAKGDASQCDKPVGYRFNLDFVVDPHGNVQRYDYATETNYYNMGYGQVAQSGGGGTMTPYVRGGYLTRVSYGYQLADAQAGNDPAARVLFTAAQRCVTSDTVCQASNLSDSTASNWPDVPYDTHCTAGDKTSGDGTDVCHVGSPTFWSTYRLKSITTQVKVGSAYQSVDSYSLTHVFSDAGGVVDPVTGVKSIDQNDAGQLQSIMWLQSIQHTGLDTSAGGTGSLSLDPVTFEGIESNNRVDGSTPGAPPLYHPRISHIHTETGEDVSVTYADPQCSRVKGTMPSSADANTMTCFPVYWYPPGATEPVSDWFNKSLVDEVDDNDATKAGSPARVTTYAYSDAAWHRDDSDLTDDQYRTWNDFRGFGSVTVTSGKSPDPVTKSVTKYFQGMDGDYKADGTTRSAAVNGVTDSTWLTGTPAETDIYNTTAANTPVVAKTLTDAPLIAETAHRSRTAWTSKDPAPSTLSTLPDLTSYRMKEQTSRTLSLLASGNWRTAKAVTDYDEHGRVTQSDAQADVSDPKQETCTKTSYAGAPAANPMMLAYPSETIEVSGTCDTAPGTDTTMLDKRIFYDGDGSITDPGTYGVLGQGWPSDGTSPKVHSLGNVTAVQTIKSYDSSGSPTFVLTGAMSYDKYGRVTMSRDGAGSPTGTTYKPDSGTLPTSVVTTNPLGWTSTTKLDPERGLLLETKDTNGRLTDSTFDALGRRTASWLPGNSEADNPDHPDKKFSYAVHGSGSQPDPSAVTTQTLREDHTYSTAVDLYDGLLQLRQTQTTTANNSAGRLVTSHFYDSHGWSRETINTYYDPDHPSGTTLWAELETTVPSEVTTSYDGLGRPVQTQQWAKGTTLWSSTTSYKGADETDTTPPAGGQATSTFTDGLGRTTRTVVKDTTPDRKLTAGTVIASGSSFASNSVRLTMQADGNLVLKGIASGSTLWSTGTSGHAGASATIRTDGSFVVTSTTGTVLWNSNSGTTGTTGAYLVIGDDASVQVHNSAGTSKWNSGTAGKAAEADTTTRYTYTPRKTTVADTVGNTWTYTNNVQGQLVTQTDPDTGTSTYEYDDLGRLSHTTDARNQVLSYTYDDLGRKTGEYSGTDTTDSSKQLAAWGYDTLADGTQVDGLPVSSTRYVGGTGGDKYVERVDGYNTAYQPTGSSVVIPASEGKLAGTYSVTAKYSPTIGLLNETTYGTEGGLPAETVGYGYDVQNLLVGTGSDTTSYLDNAQYTPLGQIIQSTYGDYGTQLRTAQTYDTATGRLATNRVSLQTASTSPVDATTYGYDQAGDLKAISDVQSTGSTTTGTDTQCFGYDGLGRLAEAWSDTKGITTPDPAAGQLASCKTAIPSASTIGGPAPYWQSYTYNLLGDRTQEVSHNTAGNALNNVTQSFTYPGSNGTAAAANPNLLTTVTTTGPSGTTTLSPHYDSAGNTDHRDTQVGTAAATSQAFAYDEEGRTKTVGAKAGGTGSSTYLYDADGGLLLQKSTASNVLYLFGGAEQLALDNTKNTVSGLRYYSNPDGTVIVRSSTGTITYQPTNPQHTSQLQVDAKTLAVTRRSYDPYGNPRGTAPGSWADNHGYLGQPTDTTTGLDLLGARNYDPVIGRFLSADPVLEAGDANQMGGYTYAGDDPVNGSDPTGLMLDGSDGSGDGWSPADFQYWGYSSQSEMDADSAAYESHHGGSPWKSIGSFAAGVTDSVISPVTWLGGHVINIVSGTAYAAHDPLDGQPDPPVSSRSMDHPLGNGLGIDDSDSYKAGSLAGTGAQIALDGYGAAKALTEAAMAAKAARAAAKAADEAADAAAKAKKLVHAQTPADAGPASDSAPSTTKHAAEPSRPSSGTADTPAPSERGCSFSPDTPVLLEHGKTRPIGDITVGDKVESADPNTGKHDSAHTVTATWINHDTDLLDVTVQGTDGKTATLHTTANHPFWDATTHTWTPAGKLKPGHLLTTDKNLHAKVLATHSTPGTANRYNLTVDQDHTYYVLAGTTPVLVHNTNDSCNIGDGYLYRGLAKGHRHYDAATEGRAVPNGGHSDIKSHVGGNQTDSVFTSWTHDIERATEGAQYLNDDWVGEGVILRVREAGIEPEIGPSRNIQIHGTEYDMDEDEHLIVGEFQAPEISYDFGETWERVAGY